MTIDVEVQTARDLFVSNDLINMRGYRPGQSSVAGVRFMAQAGANDSREMLRRCCMDVAIDRLREQWSTLRMWLFICHSTWQTKTRMSSYQRLWKSMMAANITIPRGQRVDETEVQDGGRVRYFGAVSVPREEGDLAYEALKVEPESFLAGFLNEGVPDLDDALLDAWHGAHREDIERWSALSTVMCSRGGILLRPFGFFDDVDVGVDLILPATMLDAWGL